MLSRRDLFRLVGGASAAASSLAAEVDLFTDITERAGLSHARNFSGAATAKKYLLEEMGCGVALFDYDNDGWLDIFLVNGAKTEPGRKSTSYLFHNNRDGTFTDVSAKSGLACIGWGQGCCVGDYDNDGWDDLFVSYWGRNVLYHNNGNGTFTDVTHEAGVRGDPLAWGAGCCFLDYDRDGHLDIFVASYVQFDLKRVPLPDSNPYCRYSSIGVPCGPQGMAGGTNLLFRNRGDGTFENVSERSGIVNPRSSPAGPFVTADWHPTGSYGMGVASADFDNDGWPDIYVACDTAPSLLYKNNRDGTFSEVAVTAGCAFDENGVALSGMGVAVGDYDGDGWLDIVRTNFTDQTTSLFRNNGDGTFSDSSLAAGLGLNTRYLGFGVGLIDYDNDGWKDLFIANGHVYSQLLGKHLHLTYKQPSLLYRNSGKGRFEDVTRGSGPAIQSPRVARGCAFGDLNNDGRVDLVINNLDGPPTVLKNGGVGSGHWLLVKCIGTKSNRSAVGARVRVKCGDLWQIGEVMSGGSYYSHNDLRLHFGLGDANKADLIEVLWPSGGKDTVLDVAANQIIRLEEGRGR